MREPAFWWRKSGGSLLAPFAALYGAVAWSRIQAQGKPAGVPVICLGNLTVGGAGKTPAALAVAHLLLAARERPFFLSRGYGGKLAGPVRVDPSFHRTRRCRRRAADAGPACAHHRRPRQSRRRPRRPRCRRQRHRHGRRISESVAEQGSRHPSGRRPPRYRQRPCHSGRSLAGAARNPDRARPGYCRRRPARRRRQNFGHCAPLPRHRVPRPASKPTPTASPRSASAKCWPLPASAIRKNFSQR